jgi:dienelactone hydrolase
MRAKLLFIAHLLICTNCLLAQQNASLPGTTPLTATGDLSAQMVEGIDRWLMLETERVAVNRMKLWQEGMASSTWETFQFNKRRQLNEMIGGVDSWTQTGQGLEFVGHAARGAERGAEIFRSSGSNAFVAWRVRWPVFDGVNGEGVLLEPLDKNGKPKLAAPPFAVVIPDADQPPELLVGLRSGIPPASQFARHLAESGWRVLVPALVSRDDQFSGNERLKKFTNQPHREWIYRQAYEMGRHIIGYEVRKVIAGRSAVLTSMSTSADQPVVVAGYGEGGLIALYAAAYDNQFDAVLVSGYFGPREQLWREPIYRNLSGFVREFGDAELAALIAPRKLIVEYSKAPEIKGPPTPRAARSGAAPGVIATPEFGDVESEVDRANKLTAKLRGGPFVELVYGSEGSTVNFGSRKALTLLAKSQRVTNSIPFDTTDYQLTAVSVDVFTNRQERTVRELESFTQDIFRRSESIRNERVWKSLSRSNDFFHASQTNRDFFWRNVIGKIETPKLPPNPRTRKIYDQPKWTGYEVMLDVVPDVFAWGYLLVPKDLKPGEKRPVVVCQHGLEGVPEDTVAEDPKHKGYGAYKAFAARLAERGFIVYAPHNPYRGQDKFRVLQRKANPLGLSLFSFIIAQHEVTTDWLASLPFVDPQRIAFYGLSYGGKTAMRVPAVIDRYCLSICSADFNEWVQKCVTTESPYSYMFTGEYEMPEWNLGHTFNYAEMASLIAPRPFMVERGHDDGVAPDQWVAYEFAKVQRMYDKLGIGDRTEIEFFNGPHTINGVGTFEFLEKHLRWPSK